MVVGNFRVPNQVFLVGGGFVFVLAVFLVGSRIDAAKAQVNVSVPSVATPSTVSAAAPAEQPKKQPERITSLSGLKLTGDLGEMEFAPSGNAVTGKNNLGKVSGTYKESRKDGKNFLEMTFSDGGSADDIYWTWQIDRFSGQETVDFHYSDGGVATFSVQRPLF